MTLRVLELREEEMERFPGSLLLDSEIVALKSSGKFDIDPANNFNGNTHGVRSRGWIGQIPIGDTLLVRVVPKVAVSNLFRMLEVAYNLHSFHLFDGEIAIESVEDVYERIVSILARRVLDRARKGLFRSYLSEADDLPFVRGCIDPVGTILNKSRGIPRIPCRYEEHTADLQDNRILLWALHQVRRQALRQDKVRKELDRARRALAGTITLQKYSPADCIRRFYHRLNADYAPMHGLCRFILEQSGPGIDSGDRTFIPFELYMPGLFETFVAEWLRTNAPDGMTVHAKHNAQLDSNFQMKIHIDILIREEETQRPLAVLDAKYKASEHPLEEDIYQVAFYAHELQVHRAMLVYPSSALPPFRIRHGRDIVIESLVFDLAAPLEAAGVAFLNALNERVQLVG